MEYATDADVEYLLDLIEELRERERAEEARQ